MAVAKKTTTKKKPVVSIIMGSDSDLPIMQAAAEQLKEFGISFELTVVSAHRTPDRLMKFAERKGGVLEELGIRPGIVEEQGGFRPGRGTIDQLFVLTEILKSRVGMSTYAAFIDVKKAYDTVWRQGLWKRLWDEGVRGKMWRVVKSMHSTVQSAVDWG